jgi:hypothetical protein
MSEKEMAKHLEHPLSAFTKLQLHEVPKDALMERIDRKYVFHESRIAELLEGLHPHYNIVEAAGSVFAPYHSQYLDTADFEIYNRHHRGFKNREKVRFRMYPKTKTSFLEHKFKSNKGRTSKLRIPASSDFNLDGEAIGFLKDQLKHYKPSQLKPSAIVDYTRLGFISKDGDERFSIDFNICASMDDTEQDFGSVAILEVKQGKYSNTPVISKMRDSGLREVSMSKYCLSLSLLKPDLKSHFFKVALRRIRKINHETC